jgi:predicted TIM-barrel fold metal-dependent hydrolase
MPIIDIHTHCSPPRPPGDRFGVAEALAGTPVGRNVVTNYRGLPAVSYREMGDFEHQQEVCAKAGVTGRIISTPFAAEVMTAISNSPSLDICKAINDGIASVVARSPTNWGLGTLNPLEDRHIVEGERCLSALGFKGLLICSSWHGRFIDGDDYFA